MIQMYQEGHSSGEIAAKFKTFKTVILNILRRHNVPIRPQGGVSTLPPNGRETIINLIQQGLNDREIAAQTGFSIGQIYQISQHYPDRAKGRAGRPTMWSPEQTERIIQMYTQEGISATEIANRFQVPPSLVVSLLQRYHIPLNGIGDNFTAWRPRNYNRLNQDDYSRIEQMYRREGKSISQISKETGINPGSISYFLRTRGLRNEKNPFNANTVNLELEQQILNQYRPTENVAQLAARLGIPYHNAWRTLRRNHLI